MSFDSYKEISEVLTEFNITEIEACYIEVQDLPIRETFRSELKYNLREFTFENSEHAICEIIIFPLLREVYKSYRDLFTLWSHKSITYTPI